MFSPTSSWIVVVGPRLPRTRGRNLRGWGLAVAMLKHDTFLLRDRQAGSMRGRDHTSCGHRQLLYLTGTLSVGNELRLGSGQRVLFKCVICAMTEDVLVMTQ